MWCLSLIVTGTNTYDPAELGNQAEQAVKEAKASGKKFGKRGAAGAGAASDETAEITGKKYYKANSKEVTETGNHPVVDKVYNKVPKNKRSGDTHGKCTEASICNKILKDVEKATGKEIKTVRQAKKYLKGTKVDVRNTKTKTGAGTKKKACSSCDGVQNILEIDDVNKGT